MSNKPSDFDFDDDIFGNGNGNGHDDDTPDMFDFSDGPELPAADADELPTAPIPAAEADMPEIVVEPEPGGGVSRSFVLLALALVAVFVIGLIGLVLLATRPVPPTPLEQTSTAVALLNSTVEAQLAATQTQSIEILALTQTAAAASPTPEPTLTPTVPTPEPTIPPTATVDPAVILQTQQAQAFSETATALANPTTPPTEAATQAPTTPPTEAPTGLPTASPTSDYANLFATEAAYATQSANVDSAIFATLQALATAAAGNPQTSIIVPPGPEAQATTDALIGQANIASTAAAQINTALDAFALTAAPLQTQIAAITPAAQATSAALSTQVAGLEATRSAGIQQVGSLISTLIAAATPAPGATLDALATQIAGILAADPGAVLATQAAEAQATQDALTGQIASLEAQLAALQAQLDSVTGELTQATAQPPGEGQATLVAGLQATQVTAAGQVAALQGQITVLQQQLADLNTQIAQATAQPLPAVDAQATQIAGLQATQGALSLEVVNLQATLNAAGPAVEGTLQAAATQIAAANQQLVAVQGQQATQAAQATQGALATRDALVQQLISGTVVAIVPTSPLDALNQTATALATFVQTPSGPVGTPEAGSPAPTAGFPTAVPTQTALPDTGIFDEVGGDAFPVLAIAIVGLVGVIVAARVMRRRNHSDDDSE